MFTAMYLMQGMSQKDVLMTPIPLYHLLGGISGVGLSFCFGIPQVIIKRFSASRFWKDCVRYDVTVCSQMVTRFFPRNILYLVCLMVLMHRQIICFMSFRFVNISGKSSATYTISLNVQKRNSTIFVSSSEMG
jgi:hypothetical protein